jgi:TonB family protein
MNKPAFTLLALSALVVSLTASAEETVKVVPAPGSSTDRVPLHTVVPNYPESARRVRLEGEVEVCFNVDHFGKTSRVAVRNSTNRVFEKPARDAVKNSTYHPLPDGQKLSGIKTCRTFRFLLTPVAIEAPEN